MPAKAGIAISISYPRVMGDWKIRFIEQSNPDWGDLFERIV
jgi:hypothetical protein